MHHPVPNSQSVIWITSNTDKFLPWCREFNVSISVFSSLLEDSIKFQRWVFVDIDVRIFPFFSNSKILFGRMYGYWTNAISVVPMKDLFFMGIDVVDLVSISSGKYDNVIFQVMNIITFEWLHAVTTIELFISSWNGGIFYLFIDIAIRVVLIFCHDVFLFFLFFQVWFSFIYYVFSILTFCLDILIIYTMDVIYCISNWCIPFLGSSVLMFLLGSLIVSKFELDSVLNYIS